MSERAKLEKNKTDQRLLEIMVIRNIDYKGAWVIFEGVTEQFYILIKKLLYMYIKYVFLNLHCITLNFMLYGILYKQKWEFSVNR